MPQGQLDPHLRFPALVAVIFFQFLAESMRLPPDDGVFRRRVIRAAVEDYDTDQVFIDLLAPTVQYQFANEPQKSLEAFRPFECGAVENRLQSLPELDSRTLDTRHCAPPTWQQAT